VKAILATLLAFAALLQASVSLSEPPKGASLSLPQFMEIVRHPPGRESWAKMDGEIVHRRRGSEDVESKLHLGILFTPARTVAQMEVAGGETYSVGQSYDGGPDSSVAAMTSPPKNGGKPLLSEIGLRPQDVTMGFLFWKETGELPPVSVKGQSCRVVLLESPDKSETARACVSSDYFFPIKVDWLKAGQDKPYRTLEVDSFKKESDFWIVSALVLYGPGWKTKIEFDKTAAGFSKDGIPGDLFGSK